MNAKGLKKKIYEEGLTEELLEKMGMHHIKNHNHNEYITCGRPDGDNPSSITVYFNENLNVVTYTIPEEVLGENPDIISLVQYTQNLEFRDALAWICKTLSLENDIDLVGSIKATKTPATRYIESLERICNKDNKPPLNDIAIYDESCLEKYYDSCYASVSSRFLADNIAQETQRLFGVIPYVEKVYWDWNATFYNPYDLIPIRDEIGNLIGVKARRYGSDKVGKYTYLEKCQKSQYLFGLYITKDFIDNQNEVIICESEKGVMQLWSYGVKNAVAVSGHNISTEQKEKIAKLNVSKAIIAFDEDITERTLYEEYSKLKDCVNEVTCIIDKKHILGQKESPMDNPEKWEKLYKECQFVPKFWGDEEW